MPPQLKVPALDSTKPAGKLRLKRLFERQFTSMMRISSSEKLAGAGEAKDKDSDEMEPSSVCLDRMVLNFIEESNNERSARCGRKRCNCFNGNWDDSSDDDFAGDQNPPILADAVEIIKSLVPCSCVEERNLLADASKIMEKAKTCKRKDDSRRIVSDGLRSFGYDASICKSRWEKGEYEYVDVIVNGGGRLIVDVDFRSEFEIARSTKSYRAVLQSLPLIFVGKADRLQQIVAVVSESARLSLKKKGLHFPPWRKLEYMKAKWLSPYQRSTVAGEKDRSEAEDNAKNDNDGVPCAISAVNFTGEFEISVSDCAPAEITVVVSAWQPPAVKPKAAGTKLVTGLASVLREKP